MPVSLYDAVIPSQLQLIGAVEGLLDKAEAFCAETGRSEADIMGARLREDMLPFAYQVKCVAEHSHVALEAARAGTYSPDVNPYPEDFAGLRAKLATAREALQAVDPADMEALIGTHVQFSFGEMQIPFTAENFLLSFAQPNFYFHATTAYDILRAEGVSIGKSDFLGQVRAKRGE